MKNMRDRNYLDTYGDTFPLIMTQQIRYNNRLRLKNEDLAQHSFIVAYNILKIGYDYHIKNEYVYKACAMAITHDFPEVYTSDVPHDCKVAYPGFKEALAKIEEKFIETEMPELNELFTEYNHKQNICIDLVDLGDAISVLQYVNREISFGNNNNDMNIIKNEVSLRIVRMFDKLEELLKDSKYIKEENSNG